MRNMDVAHKTLCNIGQNATSEADTSQCRFFRIASRKVSFISVCSLCDTGITGGRKK